MTCIKHMKNRKSTRNVCCVSVALLILAVGMWVTTAFSNQNSVKYFSEILSNPASCSANGGLGPQTDSDLGVQVYELIVTQQILTDMTNALNAGCSVTIDFIFQANMQVVGEGIATYLSIVQAKVVHADGSETDIDQGFGAQQIRSPNSGLYTDEYSMEITSTTLDTIAAGDVLRVGLLVAVKAEAGGGGNGDQALIAYANFQFPALYGPKLSIQ